MKGLEGIKEIKTGEDLQNLEVGQKVMINGIYEEVYVGKTKSNDSRFEFHTTIYMKEGKMTERQIRLMGNDGNVHDQKKKNIQENNRKYNTYLKILEESK
ncbi:MAG: hypothetical protein KC516_01670 [Nanoarchaeota archaeon]|nr:hypothetical protein [Nanoarchaeota archaeon]